MFKVARLMMQCNRLSLFKGCAIHTFFIDLNAIAQFLAQQCRNIAKILTAGAWLRLILILGFVFI